MATKPTQFKLTTSPPTTKKVSATAAVPRYLGDSTGAKTDANKSAQVVHTKILEPLPPEQDKCNIRFVMRSGQVYDKESSQMVWNEVSDSPMPLICMEVLPGKAFMSAAKEKPNHVAVVLQGDLLLGMQRYRYDPTFTSPQIYFTAEDSASVRSFVEEINNTRGHPMIGIYGMKLRVHDVSVKPEAQVEHGNTCTIISCFVNTRVIRATIAENQRMKPATWSHMFYASDASKITSLNDIKFDACIVFMRGFQSKNLKIMQTLLGSTQKSFSNELAMDKPETLHVRPINIPVDINFDKTVFVDQSPWKPFAVFKPEDDEVYNPWHVYPNFLPSTGYTWPNNSALTSQFAHFYDGLVHDELMEDAALWRQQNAVMELEQQKIADELWKVDTDYLPRLSQTAQVSPEQAEHIRKLVDAEEKAFADKRREVEEEVEQMHDLFFKAQNKQLNYDYLVRKREQILKMRSELRTGAGTFNFDVDKELVQYYKTF